ncbi:MAG TPA: hypothetical protein VGC97_10505, partial [Pyrinomonadaceae bacterium]
MSTKPKFYPLKPEDAEGFKKAVAWFGGREFIASLKGIIMYAIYGENMDPRSWMKPNIYPNVEEKVRYQKEDKVQNKIKADEEKSGADGEVLNSRVKTTAAEEIKSSEKIQQEIVQKVNDEWAKKIFDYWEWKRTHFGFWEEYLEKAEFWKNLKADNKQIDEFWFDYIADSGDGQMGVHGVGCMCFSDLWLENAATETDVEPAIEFTPPAAKDREKYTLLPRGYFLFVGGDTAYHSASYATLFERFQTPLRWAFTSVRKFLFKTYAPKLNLEDTFFLTEGEERLIIDKAAGSEDKKWDGTLAARIKNKLYWDTEPPRPLFGLPANHDYYDSIDGFNRQFRRPPFEDVEENMLYEGSKGKIFLQIPTFAREQEASYIAVRLPFDWWLFGIDSENEKLDFRQEVFFKQIMEKKPKKMILATPEPTTVFGKKSLPAEKTTTYLQTITEAAGFEQPFLTDGKLKLKENSAAAAQSSEGYCRLDLSGDVHHYARYWGENTRGFENERFASTSYASLVSGGGGAFFDTTSTLIGNALDEEGNILKDKKGKKAHGEIPPQKLYPSEQKSIDRTADKIFDLWNIKKGGYIQSGGVIFSAIIFFLLTQFSNVSQSFLNFDAGVRAAGFWNTLNSSLQNFGSFITRESVVAGILLLSVIILTIICAVSLNNLIKKIKEKNFEETLDEKTEEEMLRLGRILHLVKISIPFFIAIVLYVIFLLMIVTNNLDTDKIKEFTKSLFLLFHLIIAISLIWRSFDYTNWLAVRFKLVRKSPRKTFTEKLEDPNEKADEFISKTLAESDNSSLKALGESDNFILKALEKFVSFFLQILGKFSREYSYKYFPANLVVGLAIAALIFGIGNFGSAALGKTLADLILVLVIAGGFGLLAVILASETGAAYQDKAGKRRFLIIGFWHAILQLFTPFVLFYYAHWLVVLGIFALVIALNGFSKAAFRINTLFPETVNEVSPVWKRRLRKFFNFRMGAWLMKQRKPRVLTVCWVVYGLIVLLVPFILFSRSESLHQTIRRITPQIVGGIFKFFGWIFGIFGSSVNPPTEKFVFWSSIALSLLVVGFIGYRMSRVWFSW